MSWSFQDLLGKRGLCEIVGMALLFWGAECNAPKVWRGWHCPKTQHWAQFLTGQGAGPIFKTCWGLAVLSLKVSNRSTEIRSPV